MYVATGVCRAVMLGWLLARSGWNLVRLSQNTINLFISSRHNNPYTSPATKITQRNVKTIRVKDEIKLLYTAKEKSNKELYFVF